LLTLNQENQKTVKSRKELHLYVTLFFSLLFISHPFRLYTLEQELHFSCVQPFLQNMCYLLLFSSTLFQSRTLLANLVGYSCWLIGSLYSRTNKTLIVKFQVDVSKFKYAFH